MHLHYVSYRMQRAVLESDEYIPGLQGIVGT